MAEVVVKIPEELKEFESISPINWQLLFSRFLKRELERIKEVEAIVSKSKMTQEQAEELADEVSLAVSKRFLKK